jgi:phosphoribosylaminoimidazolecarboxamide formyltransferase/IMP cyclohydrolase
MYFVEEGLDLSPLACAYARARGADRLCSFGDWIALSDVCDEATAKIINVEVSDGVIAPGFSKEALEILSPKKKGAYCLVAIDPNYVPAEKETKDVFGISFEQGHNFSKIDADLLNNVVTAKKELTEQAKIDMIVALITLKYTQSNSVCFVKNGQAIGVGAGQQSRVHCTRLAGDKADLWWLRQNPKVLALPFKPGIGRPDRDNAIDAYISDACAELLKDGEWERLFTVKPEFFSAEERKEWIKKQSGVTLGSDAFFPFGDSLDRAAQSGVEYVAEPGGSIRSDLVIATADKYGMTMCHTGLRLFHH